MVEYDASPTPTNPLTTRNNGNSWKDEMDAPNLFAISVDKQNALGSYTP